MQKKYRLFLRCALSFFLVNTPLLANAVPDSASQIQSFTIVNAKTDQDIATSVTQGKIAANIPMKDRREYFFQCSSKCTEGR